MFVRNFLSTGDFLTLVPIGVPATIQYNVDGVIEKIFKGFGFGRDMVDISDEVFGPVVYNGLVPRRIQIKNGTSWVNGVFYTSDNLTALGKVPEDTSDELISDIKDNPTKYSFLAGNVSSLSKTFRGAILIRQWLQLAGFDILPGYALPNNLDEFKFEKMVSSTKSVVKYPLISNYIVFHREEVNYYSLGFKNVRVKSIVNEVADDGEVISTVICEPNKTIRVSYSQIHRFNIQPKVFVLLDESDNILYTYDANPSNKTVHDKTKGKFKCPVCGKVYSVPMVHNAYKVMCPDSHCNSRLFLRTNFYLKTLGLETLSRKDYDLITTNIGHIYSFPEILDIDKYKDIEIRMPLHTLIRACVPEEIVPGIDGFKSFCSNCNNSLESIMYYLDNPKNAYYDLRLDKSSVNYKKFIEWLKNVENVQDIKSTLTHPNVVITGENVAMTDVTPIFRGTTILITGIFRHGDNAKINAILSSYGANVVTRYDDSVGVVIVGATKEEVNGSAIRRAEENNVSIYDENDFFQRYEIDLDMAQNL